MKKLKLFLFFSVCSVFIWDCKNFNEGLPTVQFVSVVPHGPDSLLVTGVVTSKGADNIQYTGFSYSSNQVFDLLQNQVLINGSNVQFSAVVFAKQDTTYYFKSFAANSIGYATSSIFTYKFPKSAPDTAPCNLINNDVKDDYNNVPLPIIRYGGEYAPIGNFGVQATDGVSELLNVYFLIDPVNGIYTVENGNFPGDSNPYEVVIELNGYNVTGGNLYIAQNPDGSITLSFCGLSYVAFSVTYPVSAKVTFE
jgi:hypothetical protein